MKITLDLFDPIMISYKHASKTAREEPEANHAYITQYYCFLNVIDYMGLTSVQDSG